MTLTAEKPAVKERPILFTALMVQALLDGRKTQTRRVVKDAPPSAGCAVYSQPWQRPNESHALFFEGETPESRGAGMARCPYGRPGDRLWVREAFLLDPSADAPEWDDAVLPYISWVDRRSAALLPEPLRRRENVLYAASWTGFSLKWQHSMYMPRWASRITLEITSIRVERLQAISDGDAVAEGLRWEDCPTFQTPQQMENMIRGRGTVSTIDYIGGYRELWETINGEGSWNQNPWVFVVEFRRVNA